MLEQINKKKIPTKALYCFLFYGCLIKKQCHLFFYYFTQIYKIFLLMTVTIL